MKEKKATVLIVDISGYSRFVKLTNNVDGAGIISVLLKRIIQSNMLSFQISEIEGDAVLFYRYGKIHSVETMLLQFKSMLKDFKMEVKKLTVEYPQAEFLSIKTVLHYGPITEFSVQGFRKIYGQTVVEAHRLLKNHVHSNTYALVTENYFTEEKLFKMDKFHGNRLCEIYDVGRLCYTYFPFDVNAMECMPDLLAIA